MLFLHMPFERRRAGVGGCTNLATIFAEVLVSLFDVAGARGRVTEAAVTVLAFVWFFAGAIKEEQVISKFEHCILRR